MIRCYDDFINALLTAGFSMGCSNAEGIYAIIEWEWNEQPTDDTPVRWYTGDPVTDPNEWLGSVLNKRDDIAYGKLFFKKSGYITREWYPYFLAVRRGGLSFDDMYADGNISHFAKRIYDHIAAHETIPVEEIKRLGGFSRENKSAFDKAMADLQMKMFILPCGRRYKVSQKGEEYGMASNIFCTTEHLFGRAAFDDAEKITKDTAAQKIREQVLKLNPSAQEKKITKFIFG
jgi:hypothetical protein